MDSLDLQVLTQAREWHAFSECLREMLAPVLGTAPEHDDHRCTVRMARWSDRPGGLVFAIEANRFLHHMVRFLVGTMIDVASGQRPLADFAPLLEASDNRDVSPPAPPHALFLDHVAYPESLYLEQS